MAFKLYSDVRETSTIGGTGNQVLAGAFDASYFAFGSAGRYSNGDTFFYCMKQGTAREVGLGTYNSGANSISRTKVYKSTNSGNLVNFANGQTIDIFVTGIAPSDLDEAGLNLLADVGGANGIKGADIPSASTLNLDAATGDLVDVTGTTAITAITLGEGKERTVRFTGVLTISHGSTPVLPGGANITTAPGDFAVFRGYAGGVVRCVSYSRSIYSTTQSPNDNSAKVSTTAYADAVRDSPRVLVLSNGVTSANLANIDYVILPLANTSHSPLSTFSNVVAGKMYPFYNTGGSDGLRQISIDRTSVYLNGGSGVTLNINQAQLLVGRSATTLAGLAPASINS